ncbi:MAG: amidase [Pseudomonadota bacterium]
MAAARPERASPEGALRLTDWHDLGPEERKGRAAFCLSLGPVLDDHLNAFIHRSEPIDKPLSGPLASLPFAAKDMFTTANREPSLGLADHHVGSLTKSHEQASVLKSLCTQGADYLGAVRMTPLAYEPSGHNPFQDYPVNPWKAEYATGASSSGSAVAVASGLADIAIGSDTAGSLRIPAQGCGVTAWKPTHGTISTDGAMELAPSLDDIGLLARSAATIAEVAPYLGADGSLKEEKAAGAVTLAFAADVFSSCHPSIREAMAGCVAIFRSIGFTLEETGVAEFISTTGDRTMVVLQYEAARSHKAVLASPDFNPLLKKRLAKGFEIDQSLYEAHLAERENLRTVFAQDVLRGRDAFLLPVMPIRTPPLTETVPGSDTFRPRTLYELSAFTRFVNYLGLPAVAFPIGFDNNRMPLAAQLVGRLGSDMQLLSLVEQFQSASDWHGRLPAGISDKSSALAEGLL